MEKKLFVLQVPFFLFASAFQGLIFFLEEVPDCFQKRTTTPATATAATASMEVVKAEASELE